MLKSKFKLVLAEKEIKGKELAEMMGVSPTVVSGWVSGRSFPTTTTLFTIAHKLNVKVDDLYEYVLDEETAE